MAHPIAAVRDDTNDNAPPQFPNGTPTGFTVMGHAKSALPLAR